MTHYFIHYAVFHPRDYKGGNVRGVMLSEIMRKGSTRHGDYDPTGLSQSAVLAHENDMEGALVVMENASGLFGSTRVSHVETLAHNQFLQSAVERRLFGRRGDDAIRVDDDHPVLFIEPKGHGIEAFHGGDQLADAEGVVVYRYTGEAEGPNGAGAAGASESAGCNLVSIAETLWPFARDGNGDLYAGAFDYRTRALQVRADGNELREHTATVGEIGSAFRGTVGGRNMARPPWGWYDTGRAGGRRPTAGRMVPDTGRNDQAPFRSGRRLFDDVRASSCARGHASPDPVNGWPYAVAVSSRDVVSAGRAVGMMIQAAM